jgi:hypothetical protein
VHTRDISKKSMVHNGATPDITVDPETYEVTADGELLTCAPAEQILERIPAMGVAGRPRRRVAHGRRRRSRVGVPYSCPPLRKVQHTNPRKSMDI